MGFFFGLQAAVALDVFFKEKMNFSSVYNLYLRFGYFKFYYFSYVKYFISSFLFINANIRSNIINLNKIK